MGTSRAEYGSVQADNTKMSTGFPSTGMPYGAYSASQLVTCEPESSIVPRGS